MVGTVDEAFRFVIGGWNSNDSSPTRPVAWAVEEVLFVKDNVTNVVAAEIVRIRSKMKAMSNRRLLRPISKLCPILAVSFDPSPKIPFLKKFCGRSSSSTYMTEGISFALVGYD